MTSPLEGLALLATLTASPGPTALLCVHSALRSGFAAGIGAAAGACAAIPLHAGVAAVAAGGLGLGSARLRDPVARLGGGCLVLLALRGLSRGRRAASRESGGARRWLEGFAVNALNPTPALVYLTLAVRLLPEQRLAYAGLVAIHVLLALGWLALLCGAARRLLSAGGGRWQLYAERALGVALLALGLRLALWP